MGGKSVLLLGATGLIGNACLKRLAGDDLYDRIILLGRRRLEDGPAGPRPNDPRVEQHIIDFDDLNASADLIRADHMICALGTIIKKAGTKENFRRIDFTYSHETASIAARNGAEHLLLVTAVGADSKSRFFYNRVKGELETAVRELGFRSTSIFRPSLLLGERKEYRRGEEIGKSIASALAFATPGRYKPVEAGAVAAAIVRAARENKPGTRVFESDEIRRLYNEADGA